MGRKAAKVAQTKNKNDAIRTKLYGKFGKEIARAAKEGGTGTDNVRLQGILKDAKRMSVPADLIERNLKKAGEAKGGDFMELTYECYGHGGVGIVMEVLSDNVNRCAGDIPAAVKKGGGKMAESGSVLFNFERKGLVYLKSGDEDAIFEAAIEAGADVVIAEYQSFASVRDSLIDGGFDVDAENSGLKLLPLANVEVSEEDAEANEVLLDKILEIEDVDAVFTQMDTIL
jgi:YebC/PmpR family DNA-binding regulatory protein